MGKYIFLLMLLIAVAAESVLICVMISRMKSQARENYLLRRLLSDQARFHQMSLDAYIAMLQKAQQHTDI